MDIKGQCEDNIALQADEIEALTAIYADDWKVEDEEERTFSIDLYNESRENCVHFQVTLPPEYPTLFPPMYEIRAPWMKTADKNRLASSLNDVYWDHSGESVLYNWIECIRSFIQSLENDPSEKENRENKPETSEINVDVDSLCLQDREEVPPIYHGKPFVDRRSTFQAHVSPVATVDQVHLVLTTLKLNRKIAEATHNIFAYRICAGSKNSYLQDCEDDGETHAGSRLLHLLQLVGAENVCVVVTRWYGGTHLGPDRFRHINNVARSLLVEHGFWKGASSPEDNSSPTKKKNKHRKS